MIHNAFHIKYLLAALLLLSCFLSQDAAKAQCMPDCAFTGGDSVSWVVSGNNSSNNYSTHYILINATTGLIAYSSPNLPIDNVAGGDYSAYTVNYDHTLTAPNLTIGTAFTAIGGACVDLSNTFDISVCPSNTCDFVAGDAINWLIVGNNTNPNFSTTYILVNAATGLIAYSSPTLPITGVLAGSYNAYSINYDHTATAPNLAVGTPLSNIGGSCVDASNPLYMNVCSNPNNSNMNSCDFVDGGFVTWTIAGNNTNANFVTNYVLVDDATGLIEYTSTTLPIMGVSAGHYIAYTINYDQTGIAPNLTIGTNIDAIGGTCTDRSNPLGLSVCGATSCNFGTSDNISWSTAGNNTNANYTTHYVLVNAITGLISYTSATLPFSNVAAGTYMAYTINYDHTLATPTLSVGTAINQLGGACLDKSNPLIISVCPPICNNDIALTALNATTGFTSVYVLTDGNDNILQTSSTSNFTDLANGVYNAYAISYDNSNPPTLTTGTNIANMGGTVADISCAVGTNIKAVTVVCNHTDATASLGGTVSVTGSGGTPTYTYQWNNGATTASISDLMGGTYSVTVTDNTGCTASCEQIVQGFTNCPKPACISISINKRTQ